MTLNDLQILVQDESAFKKAFRKCFSRSQKEDNEDQTTNGIVNLLKGQFEQGRLTYIQEVSLPNGSKIRLKFYDVVKEILNSKGKPVSGKESFLSYIEVIVMPVGLKGYSYTTDLEQRVWGTSRNKAIELHTADLTSLAFQAAELGIDLSEPGSWCTVYTEMY